MDRRKGQVMAVSAILIILLLVSTASFYYTYIVPDTSETNEQAHMNEVEQSIMSFRSDIQSLYNQVPESWDNDTYKVTSGLAAFYPMNKGRGNIPDKSGNSNNANLRYGASWSFPGLEEHGTMYNDWNEEGYVSGSGSLDFRGEQYLTVSAWVKKEDSPSGNEPTIVSQPGGAFKLKVDEHTGSNKDIEFLTYYKGYEQDYTVCETRQNCYRTKYRTGSKCTSYGRRCYSYKKKPGKKGTKRYRCYSTCTSRSPIYESRRVCNPYEYCWTEQRWISGGWTDDSSSFNAELPTYGDWHHVTGVLRNNQLEIWINGEKKATTSFPRRLRERDWSSSDVYIGNNPDAWHGELDNVRIYDRALSKQEIQNLATRFNPPAEVSKTVDLSGSSAMLSGVKNSGTIQTQDAGTKVRVLHNLNYCSDNSNSKFVELDAGSTMFDFENNYYPDQKYVFENGAIIRQQGGSAEMLRQPFMDFNRGGIPQIDLSLVDVKGLQDISGDSSAAVSASVSRYFEEENSFSNRVAVEVESSYPEAWESYMRNEVESTGIGTVTRNGNKVRACVDQASLNIKYGELKINAK